MILRQIDAASSQAATDAASTEPPRGMTGNSSASMPLISVLCPLALSASVCVFLLRASDTESPASLEAALRVAPGRTLVNSVNGEEKSLSAVLPLVKEFGAAVIGLTMDERGIPKDAATRLEIAARIVKRAEALGISRNDVMIDCLVLPVDAEPQSGCVTLEAVRLVRERLGVNVNLGVSNVSFGLPDRPVINQAFVTAAIAAGMTCLIADPASLCAAIRATDLLLGRDEFAERYISHFRATRK